MIFDIKKYGTIFFFLVVAIRCCSSVVLLNKIPANRRKAEQLYMFWINNKKVISDYDSTICNLESAQKIALCDRIFSLEYYSQSIGIYLNKAAYFRSTPTCLTISVTFKTLLQTEKLLPCYGRHNPMRTSFVEDDFFDLFFLSDSPKRKSIFVFTKEKSVNSVTYILHDYLENMLQDNMPTVLVKKKDVTFDISLARQIYVTADVAEIEVLYLREIYNKSIKKTLNSIFELEVSRKVSLCELIFNQDYFMYNLQVELNKTAFFIYNLKTQEHRLKFEYAKEYNELNNIKQNMIPCYAKRKNTSGNVLEDDFLKKIYISDGPRRNSVLIYINDELQFVSYRLLLLIDNITTQNLKPRNIKVKEVYEESSITKNELADIILEEEKKGNNFYQYSYSIQQRYHVS